MRGLFRFLAPLALLFAFLVPAGAATAGPAELRKLEYFEFTFNTCNGDYVVGEGTYRQTFKAQKDDSIVTQVTVQAQGVGTPSGTKYVIYWSSHIRSSSDSFHLNERVMATSAGSEPNQVVLFRYSSNGGTPTFEVDCIG